MWQEPITAAPRWVVIINLTAREITSPLSDWRFNEPIPVPRSTVSIIKNQYRLNKRWQCWIIHHWRDEGVLIALMEENEILWQQDLFGDINSFFCYKQFLDYICSDLFHDENIHLYNGTGYKNYKTNNESQIEILGTFSYTNFITAG